MWSDALTPVRWLYRGALFLLQSTVFLFIAVALQGALGRSIRFGGRTLGEWVLNAWSNLMCRTFGIVPDIQGRPVDGPVLLVANHISWADIQALHSVAEMSFVAKAEIAGWPVFGFLASRGGTIFHQRGSHDSALGAVAQMLDKLEQGGRVAIFPEGGILPGAQVKRFHARLFKVAVEADCPVQPTMIRYVRDGQRDDGVTFLPGENFAQNLLRLMGRPACRVEVRFLDTFETEGRPRRDLAAQAEAAVRMAYDEPVGGSGVRSLA